MENWKNFKHSLPGITAPASTQPPATTDDNEDLENSFSGASSFRKMGGLDDKLHNTDRMSATLPNNFDDSTHLQNLPHVDLMEESFYIDDSPVKTFGDWLCHWKGTLGNSHPGEHPYLPSFNLDFRSRWRFKFD